MKNHFNSCVVCVLMTLLLAGAASAQESELERRYLISIVTEIENIKALAKKSEVTAEKRERLQFDYAALLADLDKMQSAIEQHVKAPSRSPRSIPALTTEYSTAGKHD